MWIAFAILFFVVFGMFCWKYSDKAFFLLPFFSAFFQWRLEFYRFYLFPVEITTIIFLVIFFIRNKSELKKWIKSLKQNHLQGKTLEFFLLVVGTILFWSGFLFSIIFKNPTLSNFHAWALWCVEPALLFWVGIFIFEERLSQKKETTLRALVVLFFVALAGILGVSFAVFFSGSWLGRFQGIYNSPNFLAMAIELWMPLVLAWFFVKKSKLETIFIGLLAVVSFLALLLTQSFGGMFAVFVGAIPIAYLLARTRPKKILYALSIGAALFVVVGFGIFFNSGKIENLLSGNSYSSLDSRFPIWRVAWLIEKENLGVIGIGPNAFGAEFHRVQAMAGLHLDALVVPQPHSLYLALLVGGGVFSFLGFLLIIGAFFKNISNKTQPTSLSAVNFIFFGSVGGILTVLAHGLVDTPYLKPDLAYYFWMVLLIGMVAKNLSKQKNPR